ncbi:MAG: lipid A biosynthesis lauroyl acyltransferase [Bdellovibrionota bacterium]
MLSWMKFCVNLISKILIKLPRSTIKSLATGLAILWFDILRIRRKVVIENISLAYPQMPMPEKIKLGRASLVNTAQVFFELLYLPRIDQTWIDRNIIFEGEDRVRKALEQKKGVLALSLHIGNGDLGANMIASRGLPITIITKFFKNKALNAFWFGQRGPLGVKYIEPHGRQTAFDILKTLKRNEILVFVLDQFMGKPYGIETTFFGRPTGTAYGLALFYLKTRSPVMPTYTYEEKGHKTRVVFGEPLNCEQFVTDNQEKSVQNLTQYFTDVLESIVREHPEQWMWLHRRWKRFE